MPSRRQPLSRVAALASGAVVVLLTGCGSQSGSSALGFDAIHVAGSVGVAPTITFDGQVTDPTATTKVLVKGTGAPVKTGDAVILQTTIADGYSQQTVADSYTDHNPQIITVDSKAPVYADNLVGQPMGSRIAVYTPADKIFGAAGNPQLGIGNKDAVLIIFDLIGTPVTRPDGATSKAPAWAPAIVRKAGKPTRLDFARAPRPNGALRAATLHKGTGAVVTKGQTVFARYLGQVYGGAKPFDENFSAQDPTPFQIGVGRVVKGWDKTLIGQRIGSEVLLAIPPKDGYGAKGKPGAGIKGDDTLYFVVDIVGAA